MDGENIVAATWQAAASTLERDLLDGILLLPATEAEPLFLNSSAAEIYAALRSPATCEAIGHELARRHGTDVAATVTAVDQLVDDLRRRGVVEPNP
jgi:hypothetical protein